MAHTTNLYQVKQTYYFRCRIPSDLREYFPGKADFKRTLRTKGLTNARRLLKSWAVKTEKTFMLMRCGMLPPEQTRKLAEGWKRITLNDYEESRQTDRQTGSSVPRHEEDLQDRLDNERTLKLKPEKPLQVMTLQESLATIRTDMMTA